MTLVLSCLTRDYVLQVSDRRLVNLSNGKPLPDQNKAVDFAGHMVFGYTGLANLSHLGTMPTDLWFAEALLGCTSIPDAVDTVRAKATDRLKNIITSRREWKRLAFIGVGWTQRAPFEPLRPTICLISNYHNEQLVELARPLDEFTATSRFLKDPGPSDYLVVPIGRPVGSKIAHRLNRNLARCLKRKRDVGPKPLLKFLVHAMRDVAKKDSKFVGKNLLAVSIPKKALEPRGSNFITKSDGSRSLVTYYSPPERSSRSVLYIPEGQSEGKIYGPNFVYGSNMINGFLASSSFGEDGTMVSIRPSLEPRAKGGMIFCGDGRIGITISLPKVEYPKIKPKIEKLIDEFMQAMANRHAEKAYTSFSTRAKNQYSLNSLQEILESNNFVLFNGYKDIEIKFIDLSPQPTKKTNISHEVIASVDGMVSYDSGHTRQLDALLVQENSKWKIFQIRV